MKITDPNGITLKTSGKYVTEDISVSIDESLLGGSSPISKYADCFSVDEANNTISIVPDLESHNINKLEIYDDLDIEVKDGCNVTIDAECDVNVTDAGCVLADNLSPENIKAGVTILGVTGPYEGG